MFLSTRILHRCKGHCVVVAVVVMIVVIVVVAPAAAIAFAITVAVVVIAVEFQLILRPNKPSPTKKVLRLNNPSPLCELINRPRGPLKRSMEYLVTRILRWPLDGRSMA